MLQKLYIQNYAIIDEIDIHFSAGLNIITGETGAGKSILMGALSLILGDRADISVLHSNEKKCIIEGTFSVKKTAPSVAILKQLDIEEDTEIILRREISPAGKSRAFINDTPANLQQIKSVASVLVDLHRQFDTLELGDAGFQREVVDALAGNSKLLQEYRLAFTEWQRTAQQLKELESRKLDFQKEKDYNQFLFDELKELNLQPDELESLDAELQLLNNAETIKSALDKVEYVLTGQEEALVQVLKQLSQQLQSFSSINADINSITDRLRSTQIELQDIADEAAHVGNKVQYDPQRINDINERLAAGYKLQKKHGAQTTAELLRVQQSLEEKLAAVLSLDDTILSLTGKVDEQHRQVKTIADKLSAARHKQAEPLAKDVNALLKKVGMPNAVLKVSISETALHADGKDAIEFLFDANKSNRFEPLSKVASGGELSRLMLCIKSLVAASVDLPTMIFDEIDTGISGEAAKQVGIIMKQLALNRQIISITHQPQIASKADAHYFVYKAVKGNTIHTNIRILENEDRITAIAKMLGGEAPSAAAVENAKEMLMQ